MGLFSFKKRKPKIGLALSGGGMRGIAHIAVLKALEEYGLKPDIISGTSAGAVVAVFYSYGVPPEKMLEIAKRSKFFSRSAIRFSKNGLFNSQFLVKLVSDYLPKDDFEILKIPVFIAASELTHGVVEFFSTGKLSEAILASSSVPFVFSPVKIDGKVYVDGGVLDNMPIEPLMGNCDLLIGSHVNAMGYEDLDKMSLMKEFDRILHMAIAKSVYLKKMHCDIFLDPPAMTQFSLFSKKNIDDVYNIVYDFTCNELEEKGYRKVL